MGRVIVAALLTAVSVLSLVAPWVGTVAGYLFVAMTPQDVWYWDFVGFRPEFWMLCATGIGFVIAIVTRRVRFETLKNRRTLFLMILMLCFVTSYYFGPFTQVSGPYRFQSAVYRYDELYKIAILFIMASVCIDRESRLKALYGVLVMAGVYMTYWANHQYLSGHYFGRLNGPASPFGQGMYTDQNSFAMLFVVLQPFIWYTGAIQRRPLAKWAIWLIIPFCWSAVFLTGSRGGLLGLGVTILLFALRSERRIIGLALIPAFILVFVWQGGSVMKERAVRITEYHQKGSAEDRLQSWRAALRMIRAHPLSGVGLASYGPAFPHYSDKKPREAHNTLLQIAAESGVLAGIMYIAIVVSSLRALWRNGIRLKRESQDAMYTFLFAANEATLVAFTGLVVCSVFLSLQDFEIFYCLVVMTNSVLFLSRGQRESGGASNSVQTVAVMASSQWGGNDL